MIFLLMVVALLALAWGLADFQLSAPIERPEPAPIVKQVKPPPPPEIPAADAAGGIDTSGDSNAATPVEPTSSPASEQAKN